MQMSEKAKEEISKPSLCFIKRCSDLKKKSSTSQDKDSCLRQNSHFHLQLPVPSILGDKCLSAVLAPWSVGFSHSSPSKPAQAENVKHNFYFVGLTNFDYLKLGNT